MTLPFNMGGGGGGGGDTRPLFHCGLSLFLRELPFCRFWFQQNQIAQSFFASDIILFMHKWFVLTSNFVVFY